MTKLLVSALETDHLFPEMLWSAIFLVNINRNKNKMIKVRKNGKGNQTWLLAEDRMSKTYIYVFWDAHYVLIGGHAALKEK